VWKEDNRPARGGWAPGEYLNKCRSGCDEEFIGDKRACSCADCAYGPQPVPEPKTVSKDDITRQLIDSLSYGPGITPGGTKQKLLKHLGLES
jgi:hypothetical protein